MVMAATMAARPPEVPLKLDILEGDGAVYNLRGRGFTMPLVRISEPDGRPVKGATVTFRLPDAGPGALFAEWRIAVVTTDAGGEVTVPPMKLNSQLGQWEIRIAAAHRGMVAMASLQQINAAPVEAIAARGGRRSRSVYWLVAIAAGAATAATVGLTGGASAGGRAGSVSTPGTAASSSAPSLAISPGSGSAGAP